MRSKEEFREIIETARECGLESVEIEGVKYTLGREIKTPLAVVPDLKPEEIVKPMSVLDQYTEEEILYYSTPYFDELQAKKEAMNNQRKQDDELKRA